MSDILDTMYEGYCEQVYTLSETLAAFAQRKVFAEDCEGKYDSAFLRFLPRRSGKTLPFRQKMLNKPSVYVRPSSQKDRVSLESFSVQFQEELYDDEEKEDFLDLDSLVLVQSLEEESLQGALWWEILGERNGDTFYVRSLFVCPEFRKQGGGKKLLDSVSEEHASALGCRFIGLDAPDHVIPFYQRLGFRRVGQEQKTEGMFYLTKKVEL